MANKRRSREVYRKKLGRYKVTRKDILVIEKILWDYADAREMHELGLTELPKGRRHMPRRMVDRHIDVNGATFDSIRFIDKSLKITHRLEIAARPGVWIRFTPFVTEIFAQANYATGRELNTIHKVVKSTQIYIESLPKSFINVCLLTKDSC